MTLFCLRFALEAMTPILNRHEASLQFTLCVQGDGFVILFAAYKFGADLLEDLKDCGRGVAVDLAARMK